MPSARSRRLGAGLAVVAALTGTSAAAAKGLEPGDPRLCGAPRCAAIEDREALRRLSGFYWGRSRPVRAPARSPSAPVFQLRLRSGHATGLVGGANLRRTQVFGLDSGRFQRGVWYVLTARAARELRARGADLKPRRLPRIPPRSC